ncbi:uncharacterized protein [Montipora capricornis]|uniref:uncharacterized protein n=1 Tax=Montipora capricornis TaxID=246305 RepID=UPI0035F1AF00
MSLSTFLNALHDVECSFRVTSSEVRDVESAVLEGLSTILNKGQTLKFESIDEAATINIPESGEDSIITYGDLFSVEKILPVGSFYEGTKLILPNEFDFNIKINVGEIDIRQGCRPGRVQVTFKSGHQKSLQNLCELFSGMLDASLESLTDVEKRITRETGTLHILSISSSSFQVPCLELKWEGANFVFQITVDIMPSIPCTDTFMEEIAKDDNFPSVFHQLVKDLGCFLVPKTCSRDCGKCFHVSFAQAELHLMQSMDEVHRKCYRVVKWLLCSHILESYKVKMAILDHVYNAKCRSQAGIVECVLAVLEALVNDYDNLKMPTFFLRSCCLITKDGEGTARYLDYLIDATGLDMSKIPGMQTEFTKLHSYNFCNWLDMFVWYEFQRRCISLMISMLRYLADVEESLHLGSYRRMFAALTVFLDTKIGALSIPGLNGVPRSTARPTTREWRDKVPNLSKRVFIPAFSLILDNIQAILGQTFSVPGVSSIPPIPLCLPSPVMGFSQDCGGSTQWKDPNGDLYLRQGAMCYFAELRGGCWCPHAFGKMSFVESFKESYDSFISGMLSSSQGGPSSRLIRGSSLNVGPADESADREAEIPDFQGPFYFNVRYDGEAFMEKIVSQWNYKRCLIRFLVNRMLVGIHLKRNERPDFPFSTS